MTPALLAATSTGQLVRWLLAVVVVGSIVGLVVVPALRQGWREGRAEGRAERQRRDQVQVRAWSDTAQPPRPNPSGHPDPPSMPLYPTPRHRPRRRRR